MKATALCQLDGFRPRIAVAERGRSMRRRDILSGAGSLAAGASVSFPAPALAQSIRQLRMVTDWPEGLSGFHNSAVQLAQTDTETTGGRTRTAQLPTADSPTSL